MNKKQLLEAIAKTFEEFLIEEATKYELQNSIVVSKVSVSISENGISIEYPKYLDNVEKGRRAGTLKGVRLPVEVLVKWLKKKGIGGNLNSIAWAIQTSIFKNGIKTATPGRPFLSDAINKTSQETIQLLSLNFENLLNNIIRK
jgi:hypothetical protein